MARRPSSRTSLMVTTSPDSSPSRTSTTLSDSLRTTSLPLRMIARVDVGVQGHPHLAPAGEHVDGAVLVQAQEGAVGGRRLGELLDLLAQHGQLLLGLLEGEGQLLVLRGGVGQLPLGLEQALLEGLDPPGALVQAPAQGVGLLLGGGQPLVEVRQLPGRVSAPLTCSAFRRRTHLLKDDVVLTIPGAAGGRVTAPGPRREGPGRRGCPATRGTRTNLERPRTWVPGGARSGRRRHGS